MKRNFLKVKEFLEASFPELRGRVTGENYPPPPVIGMFVNFLSVVQLFFIAAMFMGDGIWSFLRFQQPPEIWFTAKQYGMQIGIAVFLLVPQIINSYVITGAFEVALDGTVVFSKLETGKMPQAEELIAPFEAAGLTREM